MNTYALEYDSLIKMNDRYLNLSTWIDLEVIILNEEYNFQINMYFKQGFLKHAKQECCMLFMNIHLLS